MIGQQIQHYKILRQLGAGGMGIVYEAEDTRLGRHVALKFLPDSPSVATENVERFLREARIASSLNHPNICTIYDVGIHEGRHFIAMELLEGESLRGRIQDRPLPLEQILDTGCQLADALDAAHGKGIIHRDIKPANVFITKRGQAKLLDFGIAKLGEEAHEATAETRIASEVLTTPGMAVGSINYMSPEQARGEELDARTDLFSLGLVLYEMSTGREAFEGKTTAVVFDAILNRQPADPRLVNAQLPEDLCRVITRALEKDRRMRYQTAADMLSELGRLRRDTSGRTMAATAAGTQAGQPAVQSTSPGVATPVSGQTPAARRKTSAVTIAGILVVALAAGAGVWYFAGRSTTPVLTERDTVLVADFANTTGDPVFDDALRQAVAVQLQQSPFLTLLSDQRIQRTLRLMQKPPEGPLTPDVAREVCQRAGAKATVEGSIAALGSNFVISLGVHNCQTGEPLANQQVQAKNKEDVLNQLGVAVKAIREGLGESLASIGKYDVPVTEATTTSLEALRAYGQGVRTRSTRGDEASIPFFKQAIEKDPGFALAYAKLGVVTSNIGRVDEAKEHAKKAYELRDKVSEYERLYINWNYAARVLEDKKATKEALELLTTSYPRDFAAKNNFGVYYNNNGDFEDALKQYQAATEIAPDEPGPLSNAAYVLFALGRVDEASASVDRALELRPDGNLAVARWICAKVLRHPRAAEFEAVARKLATPDQQAVADGSIAAWEGRLKDFTRIQRDAMDKARAAGNNSAADSIAIGERITRGVFLQGADLTALKAAAASEKEPAALAQYVFALAILGDAGPAQAALPRLMKDPAVASTGPVTIARAYVLAKEGKPQEGIAEMQKTLVKFPRAFDVNFMIGDLHEKMGDDDEAIASHRKVVQEAAALGANAVVPAARLRLAKLLVKKGDTAGAQEQLDSLLAQWKNADADFLPLAQAKTLAEQIKK
jgi:tetratricopeptide (TPR) repeat protein